MIEKILKMGKRGIKEEIEHFLLTVDQKHRILSGYETLTGDALIGRTLDVDDKISEFQLNDSERSGYIILPLIPGYHTLCIRFCVLGHAFRAQGYEPIVLRDDNNLLIKPEITIEDDNIQTTTEMARYRSKRYPDKFGIKSVSIGEMVQQTHESNKFYGYSSGDLRSYTYRGLKISDAVDASVKKYLKKYTIDLDKPEVRRIYKRFLLSAIKITDAMEAIVEEYDTPICLVSEENYIQGRIPLRVGRKYGVDVYTQKKGYHEGKVIFGNADNRVAMGQFGDREITSKAVNSQLSQTQQSKIQDLMAKRESGNVTRVQYTPNNVSSINVEEDHLVGVFSHLLWDGALEPEQGIYDNLYDWLGEIITIGSNLTDVHFVIKSHPAEHIRGTNESIMTWINQNHAPLPGNFTVLPPDTDVNTYELIRDLDAGIVFASTVGLEMSFNGVPVVTGGYPPYHGFGVTHDPKSRSDFRELIRNVWQLDCPEEMQRRAERFAYFHFICKHLDFLHLTDSRTDSRGRICFNHEDITDDDSEYTSIVNQIIAGEDVIKPGCMNLK
jgi:hypothetical protein